MTMITVSEVPHVSTNTHRKKPSESSCLLPGKEESEKKKHTEFGALDFG
jgi:hypothetical protein